MAWFLLLLAGFFEVVWAVGLKYTEGFSKTLPSLVTLVAMLASFLLLGLAMKYLPLGIAYAAWVGIGIIGTATVGMLFHAEPVSLLRIGSIFLILSGIIGLKLS